MTKIICDICGKEIKSAAKAASVEMNIFYDNGDKEMGRRTMDICASHIPAVQKQLAGIFPKAEDGQQ